MPARETLAEMNAGNEQAAQAPSAEQVVSGASDEAITAFQNMQEDARISDAKDAAPAKRWWRRLFR